MQHEAISGQYQDELRLRPETLNKMTSTREICDVLEEYSERLKETLSRCKSDQATLCEAYQKSGQLVRDIKLKHLHGDEQNKQLIERLEEKVKLTSEHQNQLLQYFTAAKQQTDSELADARQSLAAAVAQKDELVAAVHELQRKVDLDQNEMQKKEESILLLQKDMKQLLHEFNLQATDMKSTILKQDKELKDASESNEALKKALSNQETFTKSICDQNNQLQEKISSLEDENISTHNSIKDLETELQVAITANEDYKQLMQTLTDKRDELEIALANKEEALKNLEKEHHMLKEQLSNVETELKTVSSELQATKEECTAKTVRLTELEVVVADVQKKVQDLEEELVQLRASSSAQADELTRSAQLKDKELEEKTRTIGQLMTQLTAAADARARCDLALQRALTDLDTERRAAGDRDRAARRQLEQLDQALRSKDDEISKQISIIMEIRAEKDRLQDKIQSMQNTIDNIQKELTGRLVSSTNRLPPEQDDNAVMCPPSKELSQSPKLPQKFAAPRADPKQAELFSLFSDTSMDGDTIDPSEVNRRFEALSRGERVAPLALGSLKRRAGVPAPHSGLKQKTPAKTDDLISLSQVKNDMKKDKTFFKNKRVDLKNKKTK